MSNAFFRRLRFRLIGLLCAIALAPAGAGGLSAKEVLVYVGTYTGGGSEGIYLFRLDEETGRASRPEVAARTENPSFLALHPSGRYLYSVTEVGQLEGKKGGAISAFSIDRSSGMLTFLNRKSSGGEGPCHLVVDKAGRHVLAANYGGGSVTAVSIGENGSLGETTAFVQHRGSGSDPSRQEAPHAHSIHLDAQNRFAFAADLGLDRVLVYRFDAAKGTLAPNDPTGASLAPRSGPRHFAWRPDGRHAYVINEMACTVTAFSYDPEKGVLREIQTITTLPSKREDGYSTAEVQAHPSGKFLYGSNRGHGSIAGFAIDSDKGTLAPIGHWPIAGKTPRNFGIDPSGTHLLAAGQDSGKISIFRIDPASGLLASTGETVEVPRPVCVKFLAVK